MEFTINKDTTNCWYKNKCGKYNTEQCTYYCDRYFRLKHLADYSLLTQKQQHPIPLSPYERDVKTFSQLAHIRDNVDEFVQDGQCLLIHSKNTGNGKTTWATKLLMQYLQSIMWDVDCTKPHAIFVSASEYLYLCKQTFNGDKSDKLDYLNYWIPRVELVVWDDIIPENKSNYDNTMLFMQIDRRLNNGLSNIFTANGSKEWLKEFLPPRLYSRVVLNSQCYEIFGMDDRAPKNDTINGETD